MMKPIVFSITMLFCLTSKAQQSINNITIVGEMKEVMWKGELFGKIHLDTISNKEHLYGLGPVEYLAGELLILDGVAYQSRVVDEQNMKVETSFNVKAPFFGYTNIPAWEELAFPDSIQTISELENYLDLISQNTTRPFFFRLTGTVETATIHIVNLPKGSKVSSPDEAHQGQKNYQLKNESSEIIGFFSTEHKAIFTHHDTFLHMHLISSDKKKMGHLDDVKFLKGSMNLFLPK